MDKWRKDLTRGSCAEGFGTLFARADAAEMVVGINARRVAVAKRDLYGVVAYLRGGFGAGLGLEHGQRGRAGQPRRERLERFFFLPFVIASRTGTLVTQIRKVVMAGVAIGPGDVHTGAAGNVNLHASWLLARIEGSGHGESLQSSVVSLQFMHTSPR